MIICAHVIEASRRLQITNDRKSRRDAEGEADQEPNRRTQHQRSTDTIERLSQATIALMTEVGFVNMTTTRIAKRAGVSRGAMLHHFANKVALVVHATGEMWRGVVASTNALRTQSDPARPDPVGFVESLWDGAMAQTHFSVSVDIMLAARGDPLLQTHLDTGSHECSTATATQGATRSARRTCRGPIAMH